jgi:hypothetical protein
MSNPLVEDLLYIDHFIERKHITHIFNGCLMNHEIMGIKELR